MKNNRKGFTLIELLAVIVILGVIMAIAVPSVLHLISKSKIDAAKISGEVYIDAVERQVVVNQMNNANVALEDDIYNATDLLDTSYNINIDGTKPTGGWVQIEDGKITNCSLEVNNYIVNCNNSEMEVSTSKTVKKLPYIETVDNFVQLIMTKGLAGVYNVQKLSTISVTDSNITAGWIKIRKGSIVGYSFKSYNKVINYDTTNKVSIISPTNTLLTEPKVYINDELMDNATQVLASATTFPTISSTVNSDLYKTTDKDGDTYYYRGQPTNNYVTFAGKSWRIIRINGNGTIRLILATATGTIKWDNNITVLNWDASAIRTYLYTWYNSNLLSNDSKIATEKYCFDTSSPIANIFSSSVRCTGTKSYSDWQQGGTGPIVPTYKCPVTDKNEKIGLITADELIYAGLARKAENINNYLYTNNAYWTMSPDIKYDTYYLMYIFSVNFIFSKAYDTTAYIRPVINLVANTPVLSGNGTSANPYVIE